MVIKTFESYLRAKEKEMMIKEELLLKRSSIRVNMHIFTFSLSIKVNGRGIEWNVNLWTKHQRTMFNQ